MNTPGGERPAAPATEQAITTPAITAEFPHWHIWHGVATLCYARLRRSTPAVVVRAHDWATLRERIIAAEAEVALGRRP